MSFYCHHKNTIKLLCLAVLVIATIVAVSPKQETTPTTPTPTTLATTITATTPTAPRLIPSTGNPRTFSNYTYDSPHHRNRNSPESLLASALLLAPLTPTRRKKASTTPPQHKRLHTLSRSTKVYNTTYDHTPKARTSTASTPSTNTYAVTSLRVGTNLYGFIHNDGINLIDILGLENGIFDGGTTTFSGKEFLRLQLALNKMNRGHTLSHDKETVLSKEFVDLLKKNKGSYGLHIGYDVVIDAIFGDPNDVGKHYWSQDIKITATSDNKDLIGKNNGRE